MSTPLLLVLLAVAAVPGVRILSRRPVRKEVRDRPIAAAIGAVAAAGLVWGALHLWRRDPTVLPVAVGLLLGADALAWIRARPSRGRRRGLPPGSLGLGRSLDALSDPDFYATCAKRWGAVFKMAQFHRPVVCIVELPLGLRVLEERRDALGPPRLPFGRASPGELVAFLRDEGHPRHRAILNAVLDRPATGTGASGARAEPGRGTSVPRAVIHTCRDGVARTIRRELRGGVGDRGADVGRGPGFDRGESADRAADVDRVARVGRGGGIDRCEGIDPAELLSRIAQAAILSVVYGGSVDAAELWASRARVGALGRTRPFSSVRPQARAEFRALVKWAHLRGSEIRERLAAGRRVPPSVLTDLLRADPGHLDDRVLLGNLVLITHVTFSNVRGVLGWVLKEALDHPESIDEIRGAMRPDPSPTSNPAVFAGADADTRADLPGVREWARRFTFETLRLHQSEFFYREAVRPFDLTGFHIPAGWLVRVCVREAHRDPTVFEDPETFRPGRFDGWPCDDTVFRPFSDGTHSEFGAELALMVAEVFLIELASRFDATATRDGPMERALNRHWSHWRPSSRLRVALERRADRPRAEPSRVH